MQGKALRGARGAWLATILVFAGLARAHDPGLSTATLKVLGDRLETEVVFARSDIEALVPLDLNHDGRVGSDELDLAKPQLQALARGVLGVVVGQTAAVAAESDFRLDDADNFHVAGVFSAQGGKALAIESPLLKTLPRGHRQFISLLDERGGLLAEALLSAENSLIEWPAPARRGLSKIAGRGAFPDFFFMGVEHILTGYDHLLFLFGLLIAMGQLRATLWTITCFTLAHSTTLALAAFDVVRISGRVVEPLIALTIIYVGAENLLSSGTPAGRWRLTLIFGLVHGLGFATELKEKLAGALGAKIALPLVSFNLGVELGQAAVAALVLPVMLWMHSDPAFVRRFGSACSTMVVLAGAWWLIERMLFA